MIINYKDIDGKNIELEVSDEVGSFYLESIEAEKSNDRKNSRTDRHTPLEKIDGYLFRDAEGHSVLIYNKPGLPTHTFNHEAQVETQLIDNESIANIMSCLRNGMASSWLRVDPTENMPTMMPLQKPQNRPGIKTSIARALSHLRIWKGSWEK